jgi:hypothetical protein
MHSQPAQDQGADDTEVSRFEDGTWSVRIHFARARLDSPATSHADVYRDGAYKCRLSLVGHRHDAASATVALTDRARAFISEWDSRGHTGDTAFADL